MSSTAEIGMPMANRKLSKFPLSRSERRFHTAQNLAGWKTTC